MRKLIAALVVVGSIAASSAKADTAGWHFVHLKADSTLRTWRSKWTIAPERSITINLVVDGKPVQGKLWPKGGIFAGHGVLARMTWPTTHRGHVTVRYTAAKPTPLLVKYHFRGTL